VTGFGSLGNDSMKPESIVDGLGGEGMLFEVDNDLYGFGKALILKTCLTLLPAALLNAMTVPYWSLQSVLRTAYLTVMKIPGCSAANPARVPQVAD